MRDRPETVQRIHPQVYRGGGQNYVHRVSSEGSAAVYGVRGAGVLLATPESRSPR